MTSIKSLDKLKNDLAGIITATAPISGNAGKRIKSFADGLTALAAVPKIEGISKTTASQIEAVSNAASGLVGKDFSGMKSLADGLNAIKSVGDVKISSSWASQINAVTAAVTKIDPTTEQKLKALRDGLSPLTSLGKANLTSFTNQLGKLSDVVETLNAADLDKFTSQMQKVTAAISPLADKMNKVSAGFSKFPASVKNVINANTALSASNTKTAKSFGVMGLGISGSLARFAAVTVVVKQLANVVGGWITDTNAYIENLNLFNVSMGRFAEEAKAYAETVGDVMGIDPSDWLRAQGTFQTLATGFGVVSDRAAVMSKNLTQLGYDISSFYNIAQSDAMQKLESAFAGELEPVRRLGYDLSQARLEAVALSLGIDKAVSSMTQAEKAELRYYTLMTQVTQVQGDMARTLEAPANQLRVFQAAVQQASRALGSLFIPALNAVLPYAIAFVKVITKAAQVLAGLFGFELPVMDSSSFDEVSSSVGGITDEMDTATDAAKELKGALAGFDEINLIAQPDSSGGAGDINAGGGGFNFELPEYDFIDSAMQTKVEQLVDEMKEWLGLTDDINSWADFFNTRLGEILKIIGAIGAGIAMWRIADAVADASQLAKILGSIGIVALEFVLVKTSTDDFLAEGGTIWDLIRGLLTAGVATWALYTIWGTKGLTIGIGVSMIAMLTSLATQIKSGAVDANDFKATVVGLVITALGGLMGMTIAKQIEGMSMGTGALFGLSMGAALVLSVTNIAAIAGGQYEAGSIESVIRTILSSALAGIAGATLLTAFTAIGAGAAFALSFGIALVINVIGISIANNEAIEKMVSEAFYKFDDGKVSISGLAGAFSELMTEIKNANQPIIDNGNLISTTIDKDIIPATKEIDKISEAIKNGYFTAEEKIPELVKQFETLRDDTSGVLDTIYDNIIDNVAGALSDTLEKAGIYVPGLIDSLNQLKGDVSATLTEAANKVAEAKKGMEEGTVSASEYVAALDEYNNVVKAYFGDNTTKAIDAIDTLSSSLEGINWGDSKEANEAFSSISTAASEAYLSVDQSLNSIKESLKIAIKQAELEGNTTLADTLRETLTLTDTWAAEQKNEISSKLTEVYDSVQLDIISKTQTVADEASQKWSEMNFLEKMAAGGSEAAYVKNAIDQYKTNIVDPLSTEIQETFDNLGIDGAPWASDAINTILENGFKKVMTNDGRAWGYIDEFDGELTTTIQTTLSNVAKNVDTNAFGQEMLGSVATGLADNTSIAKDAMVDIGSNMMEGVQEGVKDNLPDGSWWENSFVYKVIKTIQEKLDIHSPSTVMRDEVGKPMAEGVLEGFDGLDTDIGNIWKTLSENALTKASEIKKNITDAWTTIKTDTQTKFTETKNILSTNLDAMKSKTTTIFGEIQNKAVTAVGNIKSGMETKWNEIKSWWQNLSLPSFKIKMPHFTWSTSSVNILGASFEVPKLNVSWYANGGFPSTGQMFIAREAGPELVGTMNGRTAVANNDQIVEGIAQGVYDAVMSAIANNGVFQRIEQNTRAAAEKELVIAPSAELGRVNSKSAKMYDKARGYA